MTYETDSEFLHHTSCEACGSSDANSVYSDGHTYCHACEHWEPGEGGSFDRAPRAETEFTAIDGDIRPLKARGITQETCKKFGYKQGQYGGRPAQICDVRNAEGKLVAQKVRLKDKQFAVVGSLDEKPLIGMHLWSGGKKLVICEGEIDMLTMSQVQDNKWPVVSLPNGAKSAPKVIANNLDYLSQFEQVILCFDMDEPGRDAASKTADILISVTDVRIMQLPLKDPNEMLQANRVAELVSAMWNAKEHKPDGMVTLDDIFDDVLTPTVRGLPWWHVDLDAATFGRRYGEIHILGAGTGMGKTDFLIQQLEFDIWDLRQPVGIFFLEQAPKETVKRILGKHDGATYHLPGEHNTDQLKASLNEMRDLGLVELYDNFGQCDWSSIKPKILYLISKGYKIFYIDHLTALATGGEKDEKRELEDIMGDIAAFAKAHDVLFMLVSHLTTPDGKSHEEGGRVTIKQFKGSRAIGYWSHFMYGMERNQQAEDEDERHTTIFRILKDRLTGQGVGQTFPLGYDKPTGRLLAKQVEPDNPFGDESDDKPPF